MLLHCVSFEAMWYLIKEIFSKSTWSERILASFRINKSLTYETFRLHIVLDLFLLISQFSESVNDQTLDDGQNDNDDKEEKRDIKGESEKLL